MAVNKSRLSLIIVPDGYVPKNEAQLSTLYSVNVNYLQNNDGSDGYFIMIEESDMLQLHPDTLFNTIADVMSMNMPNYEFIFNISHVYMATDNFALINPKIIIGLFAIDDMLVNEPKKFTPLAYERSVEIIEMSREMSKMVVSDDSRANTLVSHNNVKKEKKKDKITPQNPEFTNAELFEKFYGIDTSGKKKKKKKKFKYDGYYKSKDTTINSSRVMRAASSPRKSYKRHGVVICSNKKALKKDAETIKDFLKEFVPGNSKWKKQFRKELTARWLAVFVVTKKKMKSLEKDYRKNSDEALIHKRNKKIINMTRNILTKPVDSWNDPTR